ncbi:MAG: CDP-archaeol synthase [Hydrogenoanaerobacterium sp.]
MKQRIISAMLGLCVLAFVLVFYKTIVFNIAIIFLIIMVMYELFKATGLIECKPLYAVCLVFSVLVPFLQSNHLISWLAVICMVYAFLLFIILISYHSTVHIEKIALAFFFGLMVPFAFSPLQFVHDRFEVHISIMYLLLILGGAWLTDTGAFFAGKTFGKHKMAPNISPKKTIEGAVGGVLFNLVCYVLLVFIYTWAAKNIFSISITVNYFALCVLALLASLAGILGDLTASVIKRQCDIKDFGSIMPGHGGVMDRFDSVLFVAPVVFIFIHYFTILS